MKFSLAISTITLCGLTLNLDSATANAADSGRQAKVQARGAGVMPFELKATTHVFTPSPDGGIQQVVAKNQLDNMQIHLIREHLQKIADEFSKGNFSEPAHIHGAAMPGLIELRQAKAGEIKVIYQDLPNGGQIRYSTAKPSLVAALHRWFDAQLFDHGSDATRGGHHHGTPHE